ncbi:MAG: hypothetical protein AB1564_11525, partial [Chloroflexota bacterium]
MGFIVLFPYGKKRKAPEILTTTSTFVEQAWQQLVILRHLETRYLTSRKLIASWIDQAQIYYLDSMHSD